MYGSEIMGRKYLLGNEAIAHACVESGVDFVSGYPGTPSSEVIDVLRVQTDRSYYVEWSVNEKVALENALAAAWCGVRVTLYDETRGAQCCCRSPDDECLYRGYRRACNNEC